VAAKFGSGANQRGLESRARLRERRAGQAVYNEGFFQTRSWAVASCRRYSRPGRDFGSLTAYVQAARSVRHHDGKYRCFR
jgi:hypothetical protein